MQTMNVDVYMVDGTVHKDVSVILADQVAFSTTRLRHKWPTLQEDPLLAGSFMAFMALKRLGEFTGSWEDFTNQVAQVSAEVGDSDPFQ